MSVPTLRQRIRSAIRMQARAEGDAAAAKVTLEEATAELGIECMASAVAWHAFGPPMASNLCDAGERQEAERVLHGVLEEMEHAGVSEEYRSQVEMAIDTLVHTLPPLMGAKDAAERLGMSVPNLGKLRPPLPVVAKVSGRIPLFLESDVEAARKRREDRTAGESQERLAA